MSRDRTSLGVYWRLGRDEGRLMNSKERFLLSENKLVASYLSWISDLRGTWIGCRGRPKPTSWSTVRPSARSCTRIWTIGNPKQKTRLGKEWPKSTLELKGLVV